MRDMFEHDRGPARFVRVAGIDLAMVRDRSGLCVLEVDRILGLITLVTDREWAPGLTPLRPTEVVREIFEAAEAHGATSVCGDIHYRELVLEYLPADMEFVKFPSQKKDRVYTDLKYDFGARKLDMSAASRALIDQLSATTAKPGDGGTQKILQARTTEGHGDLASAFVAAYYGGTRALDASGAEAYGGRRFGSPRGGFFRD